MTFEEMEAELFAANETSKWCEENSITEWTDIETRSYVAENKFQELYVHYLSMYPSPIKNIGGVNVNTVSSKNGKTKS